MLAVSSSSGHGSMGRMLSSSAVARGLANRVALPVNTSTTSTTTTYPSSSSSSESCYSSAYESEACESSRAEVAQRMAPPQRRGNVTSSNGLVLPWANGGGFSIVTASSTTIPASTPSAAAAARSNNSGKKKKKRPGLPVSLNSISADLSKGINPSEFVQNANPIIINNGAGAGRGESQMIIQNGNERSPVKDMLNKQ